MYSLLNTGENVQVKLIQVMTLSSACCRSYSAVDRALLSCLALLHLWICVDLWLSGRDGDLQQEW